ncbi:Abi-alpha family protein [Natronohydrobacter thiooxidans]|uniref:Abi-alpha family protein n=1 Tax=Natronohydrobacter thiooxidans TaxID=87172 RepID=UPI000AD23A08|nr:Abi-alpha family protein [Natronohydrobacter thiooxidans]
MGNDGRSLEEISDFLSPVALGVVKAAAGGVSSGIRESSTDVWGALVGDPLKMWRTRRLIDGLEGVASHLKQKGVDLKSAKALPFGEMLILFDGISKEDDQVLSDMWARLIADSMMENRKPSISARSVAAVLEQMSPETAKIFEFLSKEARRKFINEKLGRIRNKEFFPLDEEEAKLSEDDLREELEKITPEIDGEWQFIHKGGALIDAQFEVAKGELLRLNLIDRKEAGVHFDDQPFRRGYQVNPEGLDAVLSEMQGRIKDLVDSRTNVARLPFLDRTRGIVKSNFELSMAGKEIAKKLSLL